jgi:hypothetical protein
MNKYPQSNHNNEDLNHALQEKYDEKSKMLEEALEKEKIINLELKERLDALNSLQQNNSDEEEKIEPSLCQDIYNQVVNAPSTFTKDTLLSFDCSQTNIIKFMDKVSKSKYLLPVVRRVNLHKLTNDNSDLRDFISFCFPPKVKFFCMNHPESSCINTNYYEDALKSALPKVTKEIFLYYVQLTKEFFEEVVKASSKCKRLVFQY